MLDLLFRLAIVVGVAVTAAAGLAPLVPAADTVNHFRPFALAGSMALLALALASRLPRAVRWGTGLAFLNAVLFTLPLVWSAETVRDRGRGAAQADSAGRDITIVTFNMAWARRPVDNVARFLLKEDADIVLLQEVTQAHAVALAAPLQAMYPHSHTCAVLQGCTQAVFAKKPWVSAHHLSRASGGPEMIWAQFEDPEFGRFRVYGVHAAWPFTPALQAHHVDRLIALVGSAPEPAILAGDLNLTPWSYQLQRLLASAGLRRHATFLRSWPTDGQFRLPAPAFLIDHVLTTPDMATVSIRTGPNLGSDHLPVIARLRLRPS